MIRAILFDAYGTLFDVHSVALTAEQLDVRPTASGRLQTDVAEFVVKLNKE